MYVQISSKRNWNHKKKETTLWLLTISGWFALVRCRTLSSLIHSHDSELVFSTFSEIAHRVLGPWNCFPQVCCSPLHVALLSQFYDVVLDLGTTVFLRSCPRQICRVLGDFEHIWRSWFARFVIWILRLEDAGFLWGFTFTSFIHGTDPKVVVGSFHQVVETDLTFIDGVFVDSDPSGAEIIRSLFTSLLKWIKLKVNFCDIFQLWHLNSQWFVTFSVTVFLYLVLWDNRTCNQ